MLKPYIFYFKCYRSVPICHLEWIEDFLKNRSHRVVIDGECSEEAAVTSGVLHGSVLGAILLLAFINDMPEHVNSKCWLFTDAER